MDTLSHKHNLLVKIAWMYYQQRLTQQEIADELGMSRVKVTRLLQEGIDKKIVEFRIADPYIETLELEAQLVAEYGLKEAVIANSATDDAAQLDILGRYAASFLLKNLSDRSTIGIGWGRTLNAMAPHVKNSDYKHLNVVSLTGGLAADPHQPNPYDIVTSIARQLNATPRYLLIPAIVQHGKEKTILLKNEVNQAVMDWWRRIDMAFMSIGTLSPIPQLLNFFDDPAEMARQLKKLGAVGDVVMRYFDLNGKFIEADFYDRSIVIDFNLMKKIPFVVGIGGGKAKREAVLGALRTGLFNVLITDLDTARTIVARADKKKAR